MESYRRCAGKPITSSRMLSGFTSSSRRQLEKRKIELDGLIHTGARINAVASIPSAGAGQSLGHYG
jgi:hypothetical protein